MQGLQLIHAVLRLPLCVSNIPGNFPKQRTGKYKSVLLGIISPFALIPLKHCSRLPLSLTSDTSPVDHVFKSVSRSFASQDPKKPPSHSSRRKLSRSGYLICRQNFLGYDSSLPYFPPWRYPCSLNHCNKPSRLLGSFGYSKIISYCLSICPCAVRTSEGANAMLGLGLVVSDQEILGRRQGSLWTLQETMWQFSLNQYRY